jgi:hypothetical protein
MAEAGEIQRQMFDLVQDRKLDALRRLLRDDYVYVGAEGEEHKLVGEPVRLRAAAKELEL